MIKLYTLDNKFIKETYELPPNFTGIVEWYPSSNSWWFEGKIHRLDGPAKIWEGVTDTVNLWYIYGVMCTKEQHALLVDIMKLKGLT